ncbi:hypothetical protein GGR51DRAFT_105304 [Nemania sp. FL0031]|nr:hypothetical protein GGR51DRAFT_105304 [Nemania sp. FL0031]
MSAQHGFARKHQQGFQCKCSQSFTRMFTLRNHIRACANERLYACDFDACTKAFVRRTDLMSHKKTHSDDKPYKCDGEEGCGKSFARLFNLKRHLRTCSGCKPCSDEEEEREGPNATRTKSIKRETTQIRSCDLGLQDNPYHSDIQCLESCKDLFASLIPTVMSQMAYSPTRLKSTLDLIKHSMDDLFEVAFRMQQEARDNQSEWLIYTRTGRRLC